VYSHGYNCTLFDPGIEVALIARGPGGFGGGRRLPGLVSNVDLFPMILEHFGITPPEDTDGVSLLPMIAGDVRDVRQEVFAELTYHTAYDPMRGIRTARHKYIRSFSDRPLRLPAHVDASPTKDLLRDRAYFEFRRPSEMLFDLAHDPLEQINLADDPTSASVRDSLRDRLERWMQATADPLLDGEVPAPAGATLTPTDAYGPDG
jgi:arylsulfatase A-like enzyme